MKHLHFFAVLLALSLTTNLVTARGNDNRLEIRLSHGRTFPSAHGKAHYKYRGGEREFELEVEDVRRLSGQRLRALVDGVLIGQPRVNSLGNAELNLNSDRRQRVPYIRNGSRVEVKTKSGLLVVSGRF